MTPLAVIEEIFTTVGQSRYGREGVSQTEHALQCATRAEAAGAPPALIVAALLHDIGHLVDARYEEGQSADIDRRHEDIGAGYLKRWFGDEVTEPIRLHVPAKRYLCHAEPDYFGTLSQASVRSLRLQSGPMDAAEARAFVAQSHAPAAIDLRRWDEDAKDPAAETPPLGHFLEYVARTIRPTAQ